MDILMLLLLKPAASPYTGSEYRNIQKVHISLKLDWLQFCISLIKELRNFSNVGLSPALSNTIFTAILLNPQSVDLF